MSESFTVRVVRSTALSLVTIVGLATTIGLAFLLGERAQDERRYAEQVESGQPFEVEVRTCTVSAVVRGRVVQSLVLDPSCIERELGVGPLQAPWGQGEPRRVR